MEKSHPRKQDREKNNKGIIESSGKICWERQDRRYRRKLPKPTNLPWSAADDIAMARNDQVPPQKMRIEERRRFKVLTQVSLELDRHGFPQGWFNMVW